MSDDRDKTIHCPRRYDDVLGSSDVIVAVINSRRPLKHQWSQRMAYRWHIEEGKDVLNDDGYFCVRCLSKVTVEGNLIYMDNDD